MPAFCVWEFASAGRDAKMFFRPKPLPCICFDVVSTHEMKLSPSCLAFAAVILLVYPVRADVTLIQKVEGLETTPGEMTIKIKGDKLRIDPSPKVTTIFNGATGELTTLMRDEKSVIRMSADKLKAAAAMLKQFTSEKETKPKLVATGQKETINGIETEQYVYDGADFKATYWISRNYPNGAEILRQLQAVKSEAWSAANAQLPDYRDFPGLPIRTRVTTKHEGAHEFTSTITAVKLDPISEADFSVPADFKEIKMPDLLGGKQGAPSVSPPQ
jgi:hypothetical protein